MKLSMIKWVFAVSAAYDILLGAVMLLAFRSVFQWAGVTLPNHDGYVQFAAGTVLAMGVGFALVARRPHANRDLIFVGTLFKASFAGTVLYHWLFGSIPNLWTYFGVADTVFAALFAWAWLSTKK